MEVINNESAHQFEIETEGNLAFLTYRVRGDAIVLAHTEVPEALEGRGIGGALVKAALEYARSSGIPVAPTCPFAASYIRRHPEYADLVAPKYRNLLES